MHKNLCVCVCVCVVQRVKEADTLTTTVSLKEKDTPLLHSKSGSKSSFTAHSVSEISDDETSVLN